MARLIQNSFNAGETAPSVWSRSDLSQAARGFRQGLNFVPSIQGPLTSRRGTWFAGEAKTANAEFILVPLIRAAGQALVIELGNLYGRVWGLDRARVGTVEFVTPFTADELGGLSFLPSGDAVFVFRRNGKRPYVIRRLGATSFDCVPWRALFGPFLAENATATTLSFSGGVLTASSPVFNALHVGATYLLKPQDGYNCNSWHADWRAPDLGYALSDGKIYRRTSPPTETLTGANAPIHTSGTLNDGGTVTTGTTGTTVRGVEWAYQHDGAQGFTISGFTSATQVSGAFNGTDPFMGGSAVTKAWREGAYSDYRGWPTMAPCLHQKRFVTGATVASPEMLDLSRINGWGGDYADFKPGLGSGRVVDDDAVRLDPTDDGARLVWAASVGVLLIGTTSGAVMVTGEDIPLPVTPAANTPRWVCEVGAADAAPAKTPSGIVYIARGGQSLVEIANPSGSLEVDADIGLLFEHICQRGMRQIVYLGAPYHMHVLVLSDGGLAFVAYNKRQGVVSATRQAIAGCQVINACVVPGVDGVPQLWLSLRRGTQRLICVMAGPGEDLFLDLAEAYAGAATATLGGLTHLANGVCDVVADGYWHEAQAVNGSGVVALGSGNEAVAAVAGVPVQYRFEGLPHGQVAVAWADAKASLVSLSVVIKTPSCRVGTTDDVNGDAWDEKLIHRAPGSSRLIGVRKVHKVALGGTRDYDKRVVIETSAPFEHVLYGLHVEVSG